jgi:hypothetical protein
MPLSTRFARSGKDPELHLGPKSVSLILVYQCYGIVTAASELVER